MRRPPTQRGNSPPTLDETRPESDDQLTLLRRQGQFSDSDRELGRLRTEQKIDPDSGISDTNGLDPTAPLCWGVTNQYHFRPSHAKHGGLHAQTNHFRRKRFPKTVRMSLCLRPVSDGISSNNAMLEISFRLGPQSLMQAVRSESSNLHVRIATNRVAHNGLRSRSTPRANPIR